MRKKKRADPGDGFALFNQGTNLVFFEKYSLAAAAYDRARELACLNACCAISLGVFAYFYVTVWMTCWN
jgi:hypothetical protein